MGQDMTGQPKERTNCGILHPPPQRRKHKAWQVSLGSEGIVLMQEYSKPHTRRCEKLPALSQSRDGKGLIAGPGCNTRGADPGYATQSTLCYWRCQYWEKTPCRVFLASLIERITMQTLKVLSQGHAMQKIINLLKRRSSWHAMSPGRDRVPDHDHGTPSENAAITACLSPFWLIYQKEKPINWVIYEQQIFISQSS